MSSSSPSVSKKQKLDNKDDDVAPPPQQEPSPPPLPAPLIARILSYNIGSMADLARLRLVICNKNVNEHLLSAMVESSATSSGPAKVGHVLALPGRPPLPKSFLQALCALTHQEDSVYDNFNAGNSFEIPARSSTFSDTIFRGSTVTHMIPISGLQQEDTPVSPFQLRSISTETSNDAVLEEACRHVLKFQTLDELEMWQDIIDDEKLALPVSVARQEVPVGGQQQQQQQQRRAVRFNKDAGLVQECCVMRVLLSVSVPTDAPCLYQILRQDQDDDENANALFVQLQSYGGPAIQQEQDDQNSDDEDSDNEMWSMTSPISPLEQNCIYTAPVISFLSVEQEEEDDNNDDEQQQDAVGTFQVVVLIDLVCQKEYLMEAVYDWTSTRYLPLQQVWDHFQESPVMVEGIAIVDRLLTAKAADSLNQQINALALKQEQDKTVDYHPNSNNIVRDILHPALYVYVKDQSPLRKSLNDVEPCLFPTATVLVKPDGQDFWGRSYETSLYQWMPTYFSISSSGSCVIEDYINNLSPRHDPVHEPLYRGLANLFEHCLPFIESVFSYVLAARLKMDENYVENSGNRFFFLPSYDPLQMEPCSLRGRKLQVITKIVDYELLPGQTHTGAWHVEGMSHEEIVLTALYIADRDESIDGGALAYKRAFFVDEGRQIFRSVAQTRPPAVERAITDGMNPLGSVDTPKGRLIVFPNSHVHKVEDMVNTSIAEEGEGGTKAKRRIVVFFLVNPLHRIVSTREVAPQQASQGGSMSLEDALAHRLQLMEERKFHKQDWNIREIELCEH